MALRDALNAVHAWAEAESALTAVWRPSPEGREPERPYLTLEAGVVSRAGGQPWRSAPDAEGEGVVRREVEFVVSVQVIGDPNDSDPRSPAIAAEELAASLDKLSVLESLETSDVAVRAIESVNAIPALLGARWEPRSALDVRFATSLEYTDSPGLVERVIGSGEIDDTTINYDVEV